MSAAKQWNVDAAPFVAKETWNQQDVTTLHDAKEYMDRSFQYVCAQTYIFNLLFIYLNYIFTNACVDAKAHHTYKYRCIYYIHLVQGAR